MIAPLLPPGHWRGRPCETSLRRVVGAIIYIAQSCCQWRMPPKDFPPFTTVQYYLYRWCEDGTWQRINHALVRQAREPAGRQASPMAVGIDSQPMKTTEAGGLRSYDAGKKTNGRKRHLLVDIIRRLIAPIVHRADIQDRDGVPPLVRTGVKFFGVVRQGAPNATH